MNRPGPPRSAAQRDQADAWGHSLTFKPKVAETAPASSWWTTCRTREEFDRVAAEQRKRIQASTVGTHRGGKIE